MNQSQTYHTYLSQKNILRDLYIHLRQTKISTAFYITKNSILPAYFTNIPRDFPPYKIDRNKLTRTERKF